MSLPTFHPRDHRRPGQAEEDAIIIDDDNHDDAMQIDAPDANAQVSYQQQQQRQQQQQQQQRMGYGMLSSFRSTLGSEGY